MTARLALLYLALIAAGAIVGALTAAVIHLTRRAIAAVARTRRINHAIGRWITTGDDGHLDTIRKENQP